MPGVGTLVNAIAIIAAGATGCLAGNKIPQKMQDTLMKANALAVLFLGVAGVIAKMLTISDGSLSTSGTMMMVISLALGAVVGELLDIEEKFNTFGEWLKVKTGNARDKNFVNAFVTASLTVCIGAMAVIGSIQDGMYGDHSILFGNSCGCCTGLHDGSCPASAAAHDRCRDDKSVSCGIRSDLRRGCQSPVGQEGESR